MEAKDTVMSPEEIGNLHIGVQEEHRKPVIAEGFKPDSKLFRVIAEAQAEISFKAGYELAEEELGKCYAPVFKDGKQAGVKEVVEFINRYPNQGRQELIDKKIVRTFRPLIPVDDWQAKLKEWEIKHD